MALCSLRAPQARRGVRAGALLSIRAPLLSRRARRRFALTPHAAGASARASPAALLRRKRPGPAGRVASAQAAARASKRGLGWHCVSAASGPPHSRPTLPEAPNPSRFDARQRSGWTGAADPPGLRVGQRRRSENFRNQRCCSQAGDAPAQAQARVGLSSGARAPTLRAQAWP